MRDRRGDHHVARDLRAGHQQRHADGGLVERVFAEQAMRAERLAVVAGVDDARGVEQAQALGRRHHAADLFVEMRGQRAIGARDAAQSRGIGHRLEAHRLAQMLVGGMLGSFVRAESHGQLHRGLVVHVPQALRHREGRMRTDIGHEQRPGLAAARRALLEPGDRAVGDLDVVFLVVRRADLRLLQIEFPLALVDRLLVRPAQQHRHAAFAVEDVHRHDLLVEAVVVLGGAKMQLADRGGLVAGIAHAVHPAGDPAVIDDRVVPIAGLMRIAPGRDRGARGTADRRRGIGIGEARAGQGKAIERRRLHLRMVIAAEHAAGMIVGQEEQQIGWFRHVEISQAAIHRMCHERRACWWSRLSTASLPLLFASGEQKGMRREMKGRRQLPVAA